MALEVGNKQQEYDQAQTQAKIMSALPWVVGAGIVIYLLYRYAK